jgi:homopolymeric O-antigen transport system permease protein
MTTGASSRNVHLWGFLWTLIRTDFKTRYHGTIQGFFWALLKPLTMFLILAAVFSFIFGREPNYALNLIVGLFLWDFFAEGTKSAMGSLNAKSYLLTKARLPPWIFVISSTANAVITLIAFTLVMVTSLSFAGRSPAPAHLALFVYYLVHYFLIVVGIGFGTSVLFLRYRDLNQVWDVVIQAGFFLAPIIYPLGILPERVHRYLYFWPPTPIIQFSRMVLVDSASPTLRAHIFLGLGTGTILLVGWLIFRAQAQRVAEFF